MSGDDSLVLARQTEFNDAVQHGDFEKVKAILDKITNEVDKVAMVNCPSQSGSTALFTTCWYGHYDVAELLILNGAKINWKNLKENSAIAMAIEQNHVELVRLLLQNGAQATAKLAATIRANTKKTINKKIDKMLEDAAVDELKKSNDEKVSGILANPLGLAVLKGDAQKVKHYLMNDKSMRALVQETDSEGNSILFVAAEKGHPIICELLLDHGAEIDLKNKSGNSPLHMAIAHNHFQTTKLLLERGANTYGVSMRYIRYWSPCNISKRIDSELKKYPPKEPSIQKKNSPLTHLTPKEIAEHKSFFDYYDTNRDGYITFEELNEKLGPKFGSRLVRRMMVAASSAANNDKISFEDFVAIQKEWDKERVGLIRASPLHPFNRSNNTAAGGMSPSMALGGPKGGRGRAGQGATPYAALKMTSHPRMYVSAMTAPGMSSAIAGAVTSSNILASPGTGNAMGGTFAGMTIHSPVKATHNYSYGSKLARGDAIIAAQAAASNSSPNTRRAGSAHGHRPTAHSVTAPVGKSNGDSDVKTQSPPPPMKKGSSSGSTAAGGTASAPSSGSAHTNSTVGFHGSKTAAGAYPTYSTFGGGSGGGPHYDRKHTRSPSQPSAAGLNATGGAVSGGNGSRPGSAVGFRSTAPLSTKLGAHHKLAFAANLK